MRILAGFILGFLIAGSAAIAFFYWLVGVRP